LGRAFGDERRRAPRQRVGDEIFELARLVAAERESGQVVPFQIDARRRGTERRFEPFRPLQWRRQLAEGKARQGGEAHDVPFGCTARIDHSLSRHSIRSRGPTDARVPLLILRPSPA
jgi:hypothetical protein